ncbi:2-amino-4-hydroxy-6-hydroxymethyldihydropteridine diphosphokinase [Moraxella sp. VT-16-12]|uniref:2-amino-4-hydroxy-6- hydroxymethyldihydropteridine diphosphokinase n=1 Tax=Moraxella sp. VT-16-12 TaxID=2014877 RepID=UPI000B7C95BF|nr:2-amino-4-hydroxy-6-hydroxymethyldihydropteridine diphosphokinase [Moraxella sp. VT-16-12]TWV80784.1 2-amino-4-hydroxy-6-hydroxymethyldihydropteridine diphosphokinase [Moraxella sp. VT-16-12]
MTKFVQIYLGLGGNIANELGDPSSHIMAVYDALQADEHFCEVKLSSLYTSKPFGVTDQPDFVNAVLSAKTALAPLELLDVCQALENRAGRVRLRHWGERSLDVDILLYGDEKIDSERLIVPHKGLFERNFVLIPLLEFDTNLCVGEQRLADVVVANDHTGLKRL